jgi:hypothetical protein
MHEEFPPSSMRRNRGRRWLIVITGISLTHKPRQQV